MGKVILVVVAVVLLVLAAGFVYDKVKGADRAVYLSWESPFDETPPVASYDLRYTVDSLLPWASWVVVPGAPVPGAVGSLEEMLTALPVVSGRSYFFAVKAVDSLGAVSDRSNVAVLVVPNYPPAKIERLTVAIP